MKWGGGPGDRGAGQDDLLSAVIDGDCDEIRRLSTHALFPLDVRDYSFPHDAPTPLQYAIYYNQTQAALLLLQLGASLNKCDRRGATPLHYCAARDNVAVAQALLANGADPAVRDRETGSTALHVAAHSGNNDIIRTLVHGGASVNTPDRAADETPLFDAAKEGWSDTCQVA